MWNFQKATNNLVKDSNAECGTEFGTGNLSGTDLENNLSFSGKLGNFPEILCYQNGSVGGVDLWNRTEILTDCQIIRG